MKKYQVTLTLEVEAESEAGAIEAYESEVLDPHDRDSFEVEEIADIDVAFSKVNADER